MSGVEFLCVWAVALGFTAATTAWAFAVQTFGLPIGFEVTLGVAVPIGVLMAAMWVCVRQ